MDLTKQNILIAGACGLIGRALVDRFRCAGCNSILAPTRSELDLEDKGQVESYFNLQRPSVVLMAAGKVGGILENDSKPVEFITRNIAMHLNIASAANLAKTSKVVFFGSSCMYPKEAAQPMAEEALWTGRLEPTSMAYATSKLASLQIGFAYNKQYEIDRHLCVIPNSAYGPGDDFDPQSGHVLSSLVHKFHVAKETNQQFVELWGTGTPKREFIYSKDIAEAVFFLLENDVCTEFAPLNIGSGEDVSICELAALIAEVTGFKGEIVWRSDKPDGTMRKLLNSQKIRALGWAPKTGLKEGISKTYEWYLLNCPRHDYENK